MTLSKRASNALSASSPRVAVIGGGLQGCCAALELSRLGVAVDLFDAAPKLMQGAGRNNEGKIHLGFTFAADASMQTATRMAVAAVQFAPLMRRWVGSGFDRLPISDPFRYGVHRSSQLSAEMLWDRYQTISAEVVRAMKDYGGDYLGETDPHTVAFVASVKPERVNSAEIPYAFETAERAVDPVSMADIVSRAIRADSRIRVFTSAFVTGVRTDGNNYSLDFRDGTSRDDFESVVNAAWEGRLAIDESIGIEPEGLWSFRVKHLVRARSRARLPTLTVVVGPFGDVVQYSNGVAFLSWYPVGRTQWSTDIRASQSVPRCSEVEELRIINDIVEGLHQLLPEVEFPNLIGSHTRLQAGHIIAQGDTDIDDAQSGLHERSADIKSVGGYHSVNTGKLTSAPLLAVEVADRILAQ